MAPMRPPVPQALDVVPASEVGELIARTDREFVDLEERVAGLHAQAAEAEQLAESEGIDPSSSTWTMVRLQRFLDGLRDEASRDAAAVVEVARQRARVRVADAREATDSPPIVATDAPWPGGTGPSRGQSRTTSFAPASPSASSLQSNGETGHSAEAHTAAIFLPPVGRATPPESFAGGAPVATAAGVLTADQPPAAAPDVTPAPSLNGTGAYVGEEFWGPLGPARESVPAPAPVPSAVVAAPVVAPLAAERVSLAGTAQAPVVVTPVVDARDVTSPRPVPTTAAATAAGTALIDAPSAAVIDAPAEDTKAKETKKARKAAEAEAKAQRTAGATPKASTFKRLPITAILEVLAVLLILVFILLRLS